MLAEWFTWGIIEATSAEEVLKWKIIFNYNFVVSKGISECSSSSPLVGAQIASSCDFIDAALIITLMTSEQEGSGQA